jgi:hypothetical protein
LGAPYNIQKIERNIWTIDPENKHRLFYSLMPCAAICLPGKILYQRRALQGEHISKNLRRPGAAQVQA